MVYIVSSTNSYISREKEEEEEDWCRVGEKSISSKRVI